MPGKAAISSTLFLRMRSTNPNFSFVFEFSGDLQSWNAAEFLFWDGRGRAVYSAPIKGRSNLFWRVHATLPQGRFLGLLPGVGPSESKLATDLHDLPFIPVHLDEFRGREGLPVRILQDGHHLADLHIEDIRGVEKSTAYTDTRDWIKELTSKLD